jgi:Family of unknown function (DUF6025)
LAPGRAAALAASASVVDWLAGAGATNDRAELDRRLGELATGERTFEWAHVAKQAAPLGGLLEALAAAPVSGSRSGHVGNWDDVVAGSAGIVDYNQPICDGSRYGHPLLHAFLTVETAALTEGDTIYLPGSLVRRGEMELLRLYAWSGRRWQRRPRDEPLFVPLLATEVDGDLVPLVSFHERRLAAYPNFDFRLEGRELYDRGAAFRDLVRALLEAAALDPRSRGLLSDLVSGAVELGGNLTPARLERAGGGWRLRSQAWEESYASTDALIEALLIPIEAVARPAEFFAAIADAPPRFPLISNKALSLASALFDSAGDDGFALHLHWGAFQMAGCPPLRNGYFAAKSNLRFFRWATEVALAASPKLKPIFFVLLPVAPFTLWPPDTHAEDVELAGELLRRIRSSDGRPASAGSTSLPSQVEEWFGVNGWRLSPYFRSRFNGGLGILNAEEPPLGSHSVCPDGFDELTVAEACAAVAALMVVVQSSSGR